MSARHSQARAFANEHFGSHLGPRLRLTRAYTERALAVPGARPTWDRFIDAMKGAVLAEAGRA